MGAVVNVRNRLQQKQTSFVVRLLEGLRYIFIEQQLLFFVIGLLLGRAVILYEISPFALVFLATVTLLKQRRLFTMTVFVLIGAWTYAIEHGIYVTLATMIFYILYYFFQERMKLSWLMGSVFIASLGSRLFLYSFYGELSIYEWLHIFVECTLAIVLLLIFMQSIPLISQQYYKPKLKNEELICLIILFSSILTGLIGWELYGLSFEHVLSRYVVLLLALAGGAAIGSTVGVVGGLILSLANIANLYQMSLLAFSGLLGGLLKEGKRTGVAFGLLVGSILVSLYGGVDSIYVTLIESILAIGLLYLTPQKWIRQVASYVPGTSEYSEEERKYLQKMRNVTAERVEQFSDMFAALSKSFMNQEQKKQLDHSIETDYYLSNVTEKICQQCFMKKRCWQKEFDETYTLLEETKQKLIEEDSLDSTMIHHLKRRCVKHAQLIDVMTDEIVIFKMNKQIKDQMDESKKIVAEQLQGVSDVMDHFAKEIVKERKRHENQEIQILRALKQMNIHLEKIDIYNLEKGNIDIEIQAVFSMYHGEGPKLIAPVLSDILKETIVVKEEYISEIPHTPSTLVFQSAKLFEVETGVAIAAKGGGLISGDSYTVTDVSSGKVALAISDGMGNGKRAREESMETLRLLKKMLRSGISEQVAIRSINSVLSLRTTDEMFATLDLALVNLHNAHVRFLKIGSAPSFIKRDHEIIQLEANNIPIGMIDFVSLDYVEETLQHGDLLIMMSDGVYEGPTFVKNEGIWLKRKIRQIKTKEPQEIADLLLEEVIRSNNNMIRDDMTIVVAKIKKMTPKWATIPATVSNV
ncbi:MAG TPA: stage II sporulation protein E [Pseudogracilibacillus sp.]|nr:stage II sporulation protein E [Pseudogracilibacillus sp.]